MEKPYYLILQHILGRNLYAVIGPGVTENIFRPENILTDIYKREVCYKSRKTAERIASKWNAHTRHSTYSVVRVNYSPKEEVSKRICELQERIEKVTDSFDHSVLVKWLERAEKASCNEVEDIIDDIKIHLEAAEERQKKQMKSYKKLKEAANSNFSDHEKALVKEGYTGTPFYPAENKFLFNATGAIAGLVLVFAVFFYYRYIDIMSIAFLLRNIVPFFSLLIISVLIHEWLHKQGFLLAGCKKAEFSLFLPVTYCYDRMKKKQFMLGVGLPFFVLGLAVLILGVIFTVFQMPQSCFFVEFSLLSLICSLGDIRTFVKIDTTKYDEDTVFIDSPEQGVVIFER